MAALFRSTPCVRDATLDHIILAFNLTAFKGFSDYTPIIILDFTGLVIYDSISLAGRGKLRRSYIWRSTYNESQESITATSLDNPSEHDTICVLL